MNIRQKVSLRDYSTIKLGGIAQYEADIISKDDLLAALAWAKDQNLPTIMVGTGSNIVWKDEGYSGLLLVNRIAGFDVIEQNADGAFIKIGAGENWDEVVKQSVEMGMSGLEQLSLIPGSAGATPVQNVGAYGQEISNVLVSIEAYDKQEQKFVTISPTDCEFGYRTSRFKTTDKGRFFIISIVVHLTKMMLNLTTYSDLGDYLEKNNILNPNSKQIRDAVIAIRTAKLPDPAKNPNVGSFFTNPTINRSDFEELVSKFPLIRSWEMPNDQVKLSAAWLIENAGFKGYKDVETGVFTWPTQPLVLVNESAKSTTDLIKTKQKIIDGVKAKFGVTLVQEPELLPN